MSEPPETSTSPVHPWSAAYLATHLPPPKMKEMLEALEWAITRDFASASACATINGGVFDSAQMRRAYCLEAVRDSFERISFNWNDLSDWTKSVVTGKAEKKDGRL